MKLNWRRKRSVNDPQKLVYVGEQKLTDADLSCFSFNEQEYQEADKIKPADIVFKENFRFWINLYGLHDTSLVNDLGKHYSLEKLILNNILDTSSRAKIQEFDNALIFTVKSLTGTKLETEQISFVLKKNVIISLQEQKGDHFTHIRERIRENKGIVRAKNTDYLLFLFLEAIVDSYFSFVIKLSKEVENLEEKVLMTNTEPELLNALENKKKSIYTLKSVINPLNEALLYIEQNQLDFIDASIVKYFVDLKNQTTQLLETLDSFKERLESKINLFFSYQSHTMNQIMKTLTIVATIFIPLTFIAGIYGMNFENIPELKWKYGYFTLWGLMILIFSLMLYFFRRKKWF